MEQLGIQLADSSQDVERLGMHSIDSWQTAVKKWDGWVYIFQTVGRQQTRSVTVGYTYYRQPADIRQEVEQLGIHITDSWQTADKK